jgi:uncharacterized LabA/DUF88 family protein
VAVSSGISVKKLGVFVDINNLYKSIKRKYGAKLDYKKYYDFLSVVGEVKVAYAYGCQLEDESKDFIACLEAAGFTAKYRTVLTFERNNKMIKVFPSWDCGMTIDILKEADDLDMVVLGSGSDNFVPLLEYLETPVLVCASNVSKVLAEGAYQTIEIPDSLLVR